MGFDREKFLAANQRVRENNPGLTAFPEGIYNCKLIDAGLNQAKASGREQVSFVWEVQPPDDLSGRKIYDHIGIGNDTGLEVLNVKLSTMGVKDFPDFAANFEQNLAYMANRVQARLKISHNVKEGVEYQQLRIKTLIENPFQNNGNQVQAPVQQVQQQTQQTQQPVQQPVQTGLDIPNEATILVQLADGEQLATAKNYNRPAGKVFVIYKNEALGTGMIDVSQVKKVFSPGEVSNTETSVEEIEEVVE